MTTKGRGKDRNFWYKLFDPGDKELALPVYRDFNPVEKRHHSSVCGTPKSPNNFQNFHQIFCTKKEYVKILQIFEMISKKSKFI